MFVADGYGGDEDGWQWVGSEVSEVLKVQLEWGMQMGRSSEFEFQKDKEVDFSSKNKGMAQV